MNNMAVYQCWEPYFLGDHTMSFVLWISSLGRFAKDTYVLVELPKDTHVLSLHM